MTKSGDNNSGPIRGNHKAVAGQAGAKLPVWKKLLFTVITITLLFATFEMVLIIIAVHPVLDDEDPYVGFSSHIPLFVEQAGSDSQTAMVTAKNKLSLFNYQRFARNKPAGTYRIFCMGGSTTFGRPYNDMTSFCGWLRAMLPKADSSRQWELINAGGVSYASYRVAALMEELIRYEPDLFIIYTGHNEFLELRTYGRIIDMPDPVRSLGAIMSRTRTYTVVKQTVDVLGGQSGTMVDRRDYLPGEVETILENSLGPKEYHRNTKLQKKVLDHYRYNLVRMVNMARSVGAKVILVTPASNLRHCTPFKSEHKDGLSDTDCKYWQTLFDNASKYHTMGQWNEAITAIDKAVTIDDRYAHGHYLRGRVLWELRRYDEAKTAFVRAMDEDICPLRALTSILNIINEVAREQKVPLVDFVALLEQRSEHATPGESLFLDHVHPTIEGNRQLALALLGSMNKQGIVHFVSTWGDEEINRVTQEVEEHLDRRAHGIALCNLSKLFRWAGKYEEGRRQGLLAVNMIPRDAESHFQVGANTMETGRIDEAISHYRQALQIEPDYAFAHCGLGIVLQSQGKFDEAIKHYRRALQIAPQYTEANSHLGNALAAQGRLDEAISNYRQALQTRPNVSEVLSNLGNALAAKGLLDEAIKHYRQAIQLDPDCVNAHYNLGSVLRLSGKLDEAISHLCYVLQIEPDYAHAHRGLGIALQLKGELDEAIGHYHRALQLKPDYFEVYGNLGDALAEQGRLDEAISYYHQALQANPDYAYAHCNLGVALQSQGKLDEAISHYRRALQIKPDYTEAHNNLVSALVAQGRVDEATSHKHQATRGNGL